MDSVRVSIAGVARGNCACAKVARRITWHSPFGTGDGSASRQLLESNALQCGKFASSTGGNMKYFVLVVLLLLNACGNSSTEPKIAAPQRDALEKAKSVDQTVQKATDETKQKIEDAEK
jgi:hypothetical protein